MKQDEPMPDFRSMLRELHREEVIEIAAKLMEQIHRQQTEQLATVEAVMGIAVSAQARIDREAQPRH